MTSRTVSLASDIANKADALLQPAIKDYYFSEAIAVMFAAICVLDAIIYFHWNELLVSPYISIPPVILLIITIGGLIWNWRHQLKERARIRKILAGFPPEKREGIADILAITAGNMFWSIVTPSLLVILAVCAFTAIV
jgi:hypothetical protein